MNIVPFVANVTPLREMSLEELWREAESLGLLRIYSHGHGWHDKGPVKHYDVKIIGHRRNSKIEVERSHPSIFCALADAINEAREMGLGEPG
jgi:hypothetical protein